MGIAPVYRQTGGLEKSVASSTQAAGPGPAGDAVCFGAKAPLKDLFPASAPFNTLDLPVSKLHTIHIAEFGNPNGFPVVFLHGGPGGGIGASDHQFFDPVFYRIVTIDQRGAGKSTPYAEIRENTTQELVQDLETVRQKLNISKWLVFGGSWGSTLSLAYAEAHPDRVSGLILRGIFMGRQKEIDWWYGEQGSGKFYPDAWQEFAALIPESERGDMVEAYYRCLNSPDETTRNEAAKRLSGYAAAIAKLIPQQDLIDAYREPGKSLALARIFNHYCKNRAFLSDNQLLKNIGKIREAKIPTWIVQGRFDVVCPRTSADELAAALPEAKYEVVEAAGHSTTEPGLRDALIRATEEFKARQQKL